jgi:mono/diheme cytochrome c family protein
MSGSRPLIGVIDRQRQCGRCFQLMGLMFMTMLLKCRPPVVLAGPALFAIVALSFEMGQAGNCATEPMAVVDGSTSAETALVSKLDEKTTNSLSTSPSDQASGPVENEEGPARQRRGAPGGDVTVGSKGAASEPTSSANAAKTPIQVYRASCLECHDSDGRGGVVRDVLPKIPDFTDAKWHSSRNDGELSHSILEGKGKSMRSMKKQLGSVDVMQMVSFVRAFQGGKQVVDDEPEAPVGEARSAEDSVSTLARPPALARSVAPEPNRISREGSRLFERFCARCHGPDGRGTVMRANLPALPDFTRPAWQARRSDSQLVASMLLGKGAEMPAFGGKISREQARELVAVIRELAPLPTRTVSNTTDDFEEQYRQLIEEFGKLRRQSRALATSTP